VTGDSASIHFGFPFPIRRTDVLEHTRCEEGRRKSCVRAMRG
jgi:hypothetical protein